MNTLLHDIEAKHRMSEITYDLQRVAVWRRTATKGYNVVGYARRRPGPLLALWRALVGVLGC